MFFFYYLFIYEAACQIIAEVMAKGADPKEMASSVEIQSGSTLFDHLY